MMSILDRLQRLSRRSLGEAGKAPALGRTYRSISGSVGVAAKKMIGTIAAATATLIVKMFNIQRSAALSGWNAIPRIANGIKMPTTIPSQTINRRIFPFRCRFETTVSLLSAKSWKKSACGSGAITGRGATRIGGLACARATGRAFSRLGIGFGSGGGGSGLVGAAGFCDGANAAGFGGGAFGSNFATGNGGSGAKGIDFASGDGGRRIFSGRGIATGRGFGFGKATSAGLLRTGSIISGSGSGSGFGLREAATVFVKRSGKL
jgi:hypothetical protein